jgi:hypothetical protein
MHAVHRIIALALAVVLLASGCATIMNGSSRPIFLHMSKADAERSTFAIDGKPVRWVYREYSRKLVSRTSTVDTYQVTYLPAIIVSSPAQYMTLTIDNPQRGGRRDVLIRRDLMGGYKLVLYLDMILTLGIGTMVDIYSGGLAGVNDVDVAAVYRVQQVPGAPGGQ